MIAELGLILGLISIPTAIAIDDARTNKLADELCREKHWGEYKISPNVNPALQRRYYVTYVLLEQTIKPVYKTIRGREVRMSNSTGYFRDEETNEALRDSKGNIIFTSKYDRYVWAKRDFEKEGYVWDDKYNPEHDLA